jgi:hypothetical protein
MSPGRGILTLAGALGLLFPGPAGSAAPQSPGAPPDSLPTYEIREPVEVTTTEQTLREIIQRSVEGEKTKLAGHRDMTYNAVVRSILIWEGKRREIMDEVYLVYEDDRGLQKRVQLTKEKQVFDFREGTWTPRTEKDEEESGVRVEAEASDRGAGLARLPFFLEDQEEYDFKLLERRLEDDHVLFKIAFRPRSRFKPLPSGTVYVDTQAYRIVHEEFTFEQNPAPLLLKDVRGVSRQWQKLPGGEWVVSRILGEVELHGGWTGMIPDRVEFSILLDDYRFDLGYDERRFGPRGKP